MVFFRISNVRSCAISCNACFSVLIMHGRVKNTLLCHRSAVKWNKKCAHCYYYTPPFVVVYNLIYSIIYNIGLGNDLFRLVSWGWQGVVGPSLRSFSNSISRNVSVERLWGIVVEKKYSPSPTLRLIVGIGGDEKCV